MARGGARPGAGRVVKGGLKSPRKTASFSLHSKYIEALTEFASNGAFLSRSDALEAILREKLFPDEHDGLPPEPPVEVEIARMMQRRHAAAKKLLEESLNKAEQSSEARSLARTILLTLEGKK